MKPHQTDLEKFDQLKADSVSLSQQWLETSDETTLKALFSDYQDTVARQREVLGPTSGVNETMEAWAVQLMLEQGGKL
jgi:hypothetical protein